MSAPHIKLTAFVGLHIPDAEFESIRYELSVNYAPHVVAIAWCQEEEQASYAEAEWIGGYPAKFTAWQSIDILNSAKESFRSRLLELTHENAPVLAPVISDTQMFWNLAKTLVHDGSAVGTQRPWKA